MCVGVNSLQVLDVFFDHSEAAARSGVVGVNHQAFAKRRGDRGIGPNDLAAEKVKIQAAFHLHGR